MKLCISTLACPGWDLQQIIDVCAANQIAGVDFRGLQNEIDVTKLPAFTGDGLDETLSRLRSRGIEIPCMNSGVALEAPAERWNDMLGDTSEPSNHGTSTFKDVNDSSTTRVVSTNTTLGRTVTLS